MKIATINCVNGEYSTGKIIEAIDKQSKKDIEYLHCYEYGKKDRKGYLISGPILYRIVYRISILTGNRYGTGLIPTMKLCNKLSKFQPDIVHIHCPNARSIDLYKLLNYTSENKIRTIITNHAEFFYTGNCAHALECTGYMTGCTECDYLNRAEVRKVRQPQIAWKKMREAIQKNDGLIMVAVSPWELERMKRSPIVEGKQKKLIKNGIDINVFHPMKYELAHRKTIIHVTSNFSDSPDDLKGGRYVIELAKKLKEYHFIIVGPTDKNICELPSNITCYGLIENQKKIAELYSAADLCVVTSERETYGLTCAESMCCGTPVVGFENGGMETIALDKYSEFIKYGDIQKLEKCVVEWIDRKSSITEQLSIDAKESYSQETMAQEYIKLYRKIMGEGNDDL